MARAYKENILDIINAWGYSLKDPCVPVPAINSGVVELKCFINNTCPFHASPYTEDGLVFNENTFKQIEHFFPETLTNVLKTTEGVEGLHFTPRYVFRHNYIYQRNSTVAPEPISDDALYGSGFEIYHDEVKKVDIPGVDETRYKSEQTWIIKRSVFDEPCDTATSPECSITAMWTCIDKTLSETDETDKDRGYDYKTAHYEKYKASLNDDGELLPGQIAQILPKHIQMPMQTRVHDKTHHGVHWKLLKRTPLFQGEDFFIRFYKQAKETVVTNKDKAPSFNDPYYRGLDITSEETADLVTSTGLVHPNPIPINLAIRPPTSGNQQRDLKSFNLFTQAYYIIELGYKSPTDNYFIIIAERTNPIFVNFVAGMDNKMVAKRFGPPFTKINGSQLIHAEYFDVIVRNHLGKLIIEFKAKGINPEPWVIERTDWYREWDPVAEEVVLGNKARAMFVPRGKMSLWGGNVRTGFIFGPLQYKSRYVSFIYPPKETMGVEEMESAFVAGDPERIPSSSMRDAFTSDPLFLPTQGNHHILFSSTGIFLEDFGKHVTSVGLPKLNQNLFVQDAQYYHEYHEGTERGGRRTRRSGSENTDPQYGGFFYDETLKEFADPDGVYLNLKTANITVRKNRYLDNDKTRHQAFDVLIGMMTGDHVFTNAYWFVTPGTPGATIKDAEYRADFAENAPSDIPDTQWFIPDCKTPVLTSIRFISDPSEDTRWSDNTRIADGIPRTPFDVSSSYFIDASDHVLTYSDSWSAGRGWSEVEHTGTLQFYLNRDMPVPNNVTDALLALQNKTFYVEIWAGYRECNFTKMDGYYKLFTGLCQGGEISYEYGRNIMTCKVEDYTAVLKGMRIFNSPWFDGVKDINVIHEIMLMAGFREESQYDPGSLIKRLSDSTNSRNPGVFYHHFDGRMFKMESFALPSAYNRLDQPAFKYKDGDPYMDIIADVSKRAGKVFFFDEFGIAHYENPQEMITDDFLGRVPLVPLYYFTVNPEEYPGQLVFNKVERAYEVDGVYNHIKLMSNTPDMHMMIADDMNWDSIENPDTEGFVGFMKTGCQIESMFGSKKALLDALRKYRVYFRPYIRVNFETYGLPLRVNDIIQINGENCRVVKVNHTLGAEKNEWWMEVECERRQVIQASRSAI